MFKEFNVKQPIGWNWRTDVLTKSELERLLATR